MIWHLVREQLRSQKRLTSWTALMLVLTIGLASFAAFTAASDYAHRQLLMRVSGLEHSNFTLISVLSNGELVAEDGATPYHEGDDPAVAQAHLDDLKSVATALQVSRDLYLPGPDGEARSLYVSAFEEPLQWEQILLKGHSPASGEIVMTQALADAYGATLGEDITFTSDEAIFGRDATHHREHTLTLVGISRHEPVESDVYVPQGYIAWSDVPVLQQKYAILQGLNADGEESAVWWSVVTWDGPVPEWLQEGEQFYGPTGEGSDAWAAAANRTGATYWVAALGVLAMLGTVLASASLARNQVQARTQWVATARAMGARASHIVTVTLLESVIVALVAGAAGIAAGWLGVWTMLAARRYADPASYVLAAPHSPAMLILALVGLSLLLGLIIAAAPAFWAARITPAAGLKPTASLVEAPPWRPLPVPALVRTSLYALGAHVALAWLSLGVDWPIIRYGAYAALGVALIGGYMLVVELLRAVVPWLSRRIRAVGEPWSEATADSLTARPRQSTFPSIIMMLGAGLLTWGFYSLALSGTDLAAIFYDVEPKLIADHFSALVLSPDSRAVAAGLMLVPAALAMLVGVSTARASTADAATREALGLSRTDTVKAGFVQQVIPMLAGTIVGTAAMFVTFTFVRIDYMTFAGTFTEHRSLEYLELVVLGLMSAIWVMLWGALYSALTSVFVAYATLRKAPIDQLLRTHS